jgi:hypothetical protein
VVPPTPRAPLVTARRVRVLVGLRSMKLARRPAKGPPGRKDDGELLLLRCCAGAPSGGGSVGEPPP